MPTGYSNKTGKNPFKGKKRKPFSAEHKSKIGLAQIGRSSSRKGKKFPQYQGPFHPRWTGGTIVYWRRLALERDKYTCQVCSLRDIEIMEVDHIKPKSKFPELEFELNNLVTLCPNCHRRKTLRNGENQ